ncbi:hypothetical protein [Sporosarcina sp. Marseille-Q4943]|uniref:hypothetical protein n=1 Tax=Sporosarcina sp. Marseille-Q4943 TaxID=2942204 RepID=UPI00208DCD3C|nr:hypothetical protein [Sporosarcina sp. Marseille-Q4943]
MKSIFSYIFNGPEDLKLNFFKRLFIGFKTILLIICLILTFTLVLAPVTIPIGLLLFRSLTYQGQFVGIKNILLGLLFFILFLFSIPIVTSVMGSALH